MMSAPSHLASLLIVLASAKNQNKNPPKLLVFFFFFHKCCTLKHALTLLPFAASFPRLSPQPFGPIFQGLPRFSPGKIAFYSTPAWRRASHLSTHSHPDSRHWLRRRSRRLFLEAAPSDVLLCLSHFVWPQPLILPLAPTPRFLLSPTPQSPSSHPLLRSCGKHEAHALWRVQGHGVTLYE